MKLNDIISMVKDTTQKIGEKKNLENQGHCSDP